MKHNTLNQDRSILHKIHHSETKAAYQGAYQVYITIVIKFQNYIYLSVLIKKTGYTEYK